MSNQLDSLVKHVQQSTKYRHVSPALIQRVGQRELEKQRNLRAAIKATKSKLHQVGGAYIETRLNYATALDRLRQADDKTRLYQICCQIMGYHLSTQERLPILDEFYSTTLSHLTHVRRVLDIACGLNPLIYPWLPLSRETEYIAYDIYADMMAFLADFMTMTDITGRAELRDIISHPPTVAVDLTLLLKTLPCLLQTDKTAVTYLLDHIQSRYLLISYPVRSLGGRSKGMITTYEQQFQTLATHRGWTNIQRFHFATEFAFLVETN